MAKVVKDYFTISELTYSSTAVRIGNANKPNTKELANLNALKKKILNPLREEIGLPIKVNSGFRNEVVNRAVKGVSTSAHRLGHAADIVCRHYKGGNVFEFAKFIEKFLSDNKIDFDQLIYEHVGGSKWVHIGLKNENGEQRKQVLTIKERKTHVGLRNI